ncbi:PREDICTED: leucine-rich repeat neuronal protein 1-like [Nanorana parkeri]|uniref:leucine-rich repeat neuronal protein 1-like n=1 Tax=Nanorana parkeri TaxID=125878 RepID=UPI000854D5AB|nr:PREDICTED: leucine-rich repeat neuronal protein 1-like [Nanorana parkeri]
MPHFLCEKMKTPLPWTELCILLMIFNVFSTSCLGFCPPQCVCETRPWFTPQSVYHEAKTVDCNDLLLTHIPENLSTDTQVLLLQSNKISRMGWELQDLVNLTELDLSQNHFQSIEDLSISNLSHLITLYLEENQLTELPDYCLKDLESLEELYINHNQINFIGSRAFAGLGKLLRIHLNANRLRVIDSRWFEDLPNLEILMIGENPVSALQNFNFQPLGKLHSLVLAGMELDQIPENAFYGLDYLESLSFFDNRLTSVPKEAMKPLKLLKFLDLNKNAISRIQSGDFRDMPHLEELSLNSMEELERIEGEAFQDLPELLKLEICNNPRLTYLDPGAFVSNVGALKTLLLNNNRLALIPLKVFQMLPGLTEISLYSNPLRCDCQNNWKGLSSLRLIEAQATLCTSPPLVSGHLFQEIQGQAWLNRCPPLIDTQSFPSRLHLSKHQLVTLTCQASGHPKPEIYWITPHGERISGGNGRIHIQGEGSLEILDATEEDSGSYMCQMWNSDGTDSKSVILYINGTQEQEVTSLSIVTKKVHSSFVVVQWKMLGGPVNAPSVLVPVQWTSATMRIHNPHISYTAKVPLEIQEYNLTHLQPATKYEVCLTVSSISRPSQQSCLNVTTKDASFSMAAVGRPVSIALSAALGSLIAGLCMAAVIVYAGHHLRHKSCGHSLKKYMQRASFIPLNEFYPPLISLWEGETEKEKESSLEQPVLVPPQEDKTFPTIVQIDTSKTYMWQS